jgi:hypothetical protein
MLQRLREFCAREEIRARLILPILSLIVLVYTLVAVFGRALPAESSDTPWILRLHPERLLAMLAAVLGSLRVFDHVQKQTSPVQPLLWILLASLVHLTSIGVQRGWF